MAGNTSPTPEPSLQSAVGGGGEVKFAAPESLVTELYKQHDAKKSPFFQTDDRARVDKYFTKELGDLIWNYAKNSSGEVGVIDGDPLYNAQDIEIKNFKVGTGEVKGETASVPVSFNNYDRAVKITFHLKLVDSNWKINDISYGPQDSLLKWFKSSGDVKNESSSNGEFEGKYKVGDTTCTVKPVKMAFEIRWAKGSGTEIFFAEGDDNVFVTGEDAQDKRNRFVFDDANYNSGKFYRADGKSFDVSRAK